MATLHVGFDEAGDFRFDKYGSKYYIFSAAFTYHPNLLAQELTGRAEPMRGEIAEMALKCCVCRKRMGVFMDHVSPSPWQITLGLFFRGELICQLCEDWGLAFDRALTAQHHRELKLV